MHASQGPGNFLTSRVTNTLFPELFSQKDIENRSKLKKIKNQHVNKFLTSCGKKNHYLSQPTVHPGFEACVTFAPFMRDRKKRQQKKQVNL